MLARMHLAGATLRCTSPTCAACPGGTRPCRWCCPFWTAAQAALITSELAYQNHVATLAAYGALPRGPIHADLFRDNVMFATATHGERRQPAAHRLF